MRRRMQHGARNLFLQEQIQDIIIIIGRRGASDVQKRFRGGVTARPAPRATVGIAHAVPWTPPGGPPPTHWAPRGVGPRGAQSHEPAFPTSREFPKMSRPRRNPKATPKAKDADAFCSRNDCPARHAERRNT